MNILIKQKESIKTKRLVLKSLSMNDIVDLVLLLTDEEVGKTYIIPSYDTKEEYVSLAKKLIEFSKVSKENHLFYGIYLNDRLIGFINDCKIEESLIEVGYVVNPKYQNNGYASEALLAVIENLKEMGFKTIRAGYFESNIASKRVMLKCFMKPIEFTDTIDYRGKAHKCHYCHITF